MNTISKLINNLYFFFKKKNLFLSIASFISLIKIFVFFLHCNNSLSFKEKIYGSLCLLIQFLIKVCDASMTAGIFVNVLMCFNEAKQRRRGLFKTYNVLTHLYTHRHKMCWLGDRTLEVWGFLVYAIYLHAC